MSPLLRTSACSAVTVAFLAASGPARAADARSMPAVASAAPLVVCADPNNMPYSNVHGEGFENRIAHIVGDDLHVPVMFEWSEQRRGFLRRSLNADACDLMLDVPAGLEGARTLAPVWSSTYVFLTRRDRHVHLAGFDDPALKDLRIGVQAVGADNYNTPPSEALALRGIVQHVQGYPMTDVSSVEDPVARMVDDVAAGNLDVAILWGPFAGWFAKAHGDELEVVPVAADARQPGLAFAYTMAPAVRRGHDELAARVQDAFQRHAAEIRAVIAAYGVPLVAPPAAQVAASP
ncbi:MAG TPA: quinoprotein dehydrogenase-associated putative ABC transporter substrate-binding protein [Burkholderiaceae bacterium]|jgi:mxaJ protein|nr:quinoprotein dehydrogenase-associated putative ABC transporter substrate-binding protein [Burkholderiaceae bacterium]